MSAPGAASRLADRTAPWLLCVGGLAVAFQWLRHGPGYLPIRHGDPRLVQALFEHGFRWVRGDALHTSLWSPPFFHPASGAAASTDTILGSAPLYWLPRFAGVDPDPAFAVWMAACLALDFVAAYWLLSRSLRVSPAPAALGAFLFGFGSARLASFNSPQLLPLFYGVFALVALLRGFEPTRSRRSAAAWIHVAAALLALQIWSTWYPSFFWLLALSFAGLGALAFADSRAALTEAVRRNAPALVGAAALGGLAIAPMLHAHLGAVDQSSWRPYEDVARLLPTWASWLYCGPWNLTHGWLGGLEPFQFAGTPRDPHANGVGFVTLGVAVAGLWRARRRPAARLVAVAVVLTILVSTRGPGEHSLWALVYEWVPGARSLRFVARIGGLLSLAAGIGVALFFDARHGRGPAASWLAVLLAGLCIAEQLHFVPVPDTSAYRASVQALAREIDPSCESFFLHTEHAGDEPRRRFKLTHIVAMWVALEADVPTLNGSMGQSPPGWELARADVHDGGSRAALERRLSRWIADRKLPPAGVCRLAVPTGRMPAYALPTGP